MPATLLLAVLFPVLSMKNLLNLLLIYTGISFALIVDLGTVWLLWAMSKGSLNVRAAFLRNLTDDADRKRIRLEIKSLLKDKFDIAHSIIELETPSDRDACSDNELFPEHDY